MLGIPNGFRRSIGQHNIDRATFLDWLETTAILSGEEIARPEIVAYLVDHQIYDSQDFAWVFVAEMWDEFKTRLAWLGDHSPIRFHDDFASIQADDLDWRAVPVHTYCLVVSIGPRYDGWNSQFRNTLNSQGQLFELITKAAMESRFNHWRFIHTGWGSGNATRLQDIVDRIIDCTGERLGNAEYAPASANDAGVDLIWHLPFVDRRGGTPIFLAQCASGYNWKNKIGEPDIDMWGKIIDFPARPNAAFSIPFSLTQTDLRMHSNQLGTRLLLDRYRLLAQSAAEVSWVPDSLRSDLVTWLEPKVEWMMTR